MAEHTINIRNFKEIRLPEGKKLALGIEEAGFDISHRCGGNARCTTCRVKFFSEEPPMGQKEHDCLEEDGVLGEFRLSCQIRVDRDMDLQVLMPASEQGWEPGVDLEP